MIGRLLVITMGTTCHSGGKCGNYLSYSVRCLVIGKEIFRLTEDVTGRTIALPLFNNLKEEQIDYVVEKLKEGIYEEIF